jgi:hypothetical protein
MKPSLNKRQIQEWLRGQRAAEQRVERERAEFLLNLTPAEALRLYESSSAVQDSNLHREEPSPLLMAMRRLLERYAQAMSAKR